MSFLLIDKRMKTLKLISNFFIFSLFISVTFAASQATNMWFDPIFYLKITGLLVFIVTVIIIVGKNKLKDNHKSLFFWLIAAPVLLSTLYLGASTVHENIISQTKGPIHWHADYQVWACGDRLNLIDPKGLNNKIGSPLFHEHNDDRIHVEGTVLNVEDIDLQSFFSVIGGQLTNTKLVYPTEERGVLEYTNGDECEGVPSELAVYMNGERVSDIDQTMYYPHALVPPGDCIIVEFGPNPGETTDRMCESWEPMGWNYENYEELRENENPWSRDDFYYDPEQKRFVEVSE